VRELSGWSKQLSGVTIPSDVIPTNTYLTDLVRFPLFPWGRWGRLRMLTLLSLLAALCLVVWFFTIRMPGRAFAGPLPALTPARQALSDRLRRHVQRLAGEIGERSVAKPTAAVGAAAYLEAELNAMGYIVAAQEYDAHGQRSRNLEATLRGSAQADEIIVVGGHYDTAEGAPGADDNGSGVAGVLELARSFAGRPASRTIRFVFFGTEEPPSFPTSAMGSRHYADAARARGDRIVAMLSIESIGYYDSDPGSQRYPFPLNLAYPDAGDFIGFVSNLKSGPLVRRSIATFRRATPFPTQGAALPSWVPGVWWSDHWSFWRQGYRAIMITDTAPFRNPFYHTPQDTPDKLDYGRMARVVDGLEAVVADLAGH
jgi:peptidase M28-like protein